MPSEANGPKRAGVPSMLDLIRMSPRPIFPPGGRDLYRQIAILTEMEAGDEVLVASCGIGVTLEYFVREYGVQGSGVDADPALVERGEQRIRSEDLHGRVQLQNAPMDELPYRDGVFDVAVGEMGLTASGEPADAIGELVRVAKPGGHVVLVQPVWKAPVDPERAAILVEHLGARPLMMVEVKKILRGGGVRSLHTEAWSDDETAFRSEARKPFPDFAELFTLTEKFGILRRAWRRWGWRGVKAAIAREQRVHRLLTRERILGLDMVLGRKAAEPEPPPPEAAEPETPENDRSDNDPPAEPEST